MKAECFVTKSEGGGQFFLRSIQILLQNEGWSVLSYLLGRLPSLQYRLWAEVSMNLQSVSKSLVFVCAVK